MSRSQTAKKTVERVFQAKGTTDAKAQRWMEVVWLEERGQWGERSW